MATILRAFAFFGAAAAAAVAAPGFGAAKSSAVLSSSGGGGDDDEDDDGVLSSSSPLAHRVAAVDCFCAGRASVAKSQSGLPPFPPPPRHSKKYLKSQELVEQVSGDGAPYVDDADQQQPQQQQQRLLALAPEVDLVRRFEVEDDAAGQKHMMVTYRLGISQVNNADASPAAYVLVTMREDGVGEVDVNCVKASDLPDVATMARIRVLETFLELVVKGLLTPPKEERRRGGGVSLLEAPDSSSQEAPRRFTREWLASGMTDDRFHEAVDTEIANFHQLTKVVALLEELRRTTGGVVSVALFPRIEDLRPVLLEGLKRDRVLWPVDTRWSGGQATTNLRRRGSSSTSGSSNGDDDGSSGSTTLPVDRDGCLTVADDAGTFRTYVVDEASGDVYEARGSRSAQCLAVKIHRGGSTTRKTDVIAGTYDARWINKLDGAVGENVKAVLQAVQTHLDEGKAKVRAAIEKSAQPRTSMVGQILRKFRDAHPPMRDMTLDQLRAIAGPGRESHGYFDFASLKSNNRKSAGASNSSRDPPGPSSSPRSSRSRTPSRSPSRTPSRTRSGTTLKEVETTSKPSTVLGRLKKFFKPTGRKTYVVNG